MVWQKMECQVSQDEHMAALDFLEAHGIFLSMDIDNIIAMIEQVVAMGLTKK